MLISRIFNNNKYQISYQVSNNGSEQRNFTHLIRCQTKSEAIHNIKHVKKTLFYYVPNQNKVFLFLSYLMLPCNYEEDKHKVPMNKPYNIQNTNICNGIFHISFFKALLINEGETTRDEMKSGRNDPGRTGIGGETTHGMNGIRGEATRIRWWFTRVVCRRRCYVVVRLQPSFK